VDWHGSCTAEDLPPGRGRPLAVEEQGFCGAAQHEPHVMELEGAKGGRTFGLGHWDLPTAGDARGGTRAGESVTGSHDQHQLLVECSSSGKELRLRCGGRMEGAGELCGWCGWRWEMSP
jgi:hypothetical protein